MNKMIIQINSPKLKQKKKKNKVKSKIHMTLQTIKAMLILCPQLKILIFKKIILLLTNKNCRFSKFNKNNFQTINIKNKNKNNWMKLIALLKI